MPTSTVRTFSDPDDFAASIRAAEVEVISIGRGRFAAKVTRIDFDGLWINRYFENLPRIVHAAQTTERALIQFLATPGQGLFVGGVEIGPTNIFRHSASDSFYQRLSESGSFAVMSLPVEDTAVVGEALAEIDLTPPRNGTLVTPPPGAIAKLRRLHAAAANLAEEASEIVTHPEAARGLEQALIATLVDCFGHGGERKSRLAQGQHAVVMRRFRRIVEENPEEPLYIPEICNAIGVSSRALQTCCQEHLRMAPKRYLMLRRMHLARRALRAAAPEAASVTDIATRFGFWQLGRFAVEYQALFGEPPSATLRRTPD